jgi:hypothetical protein
MMIINLTIAIVIVMMVMLLLVVIMMISVGKRGNAGTNNRSSAVRKKGPNVDYFIWVIIFPGSIMDFPLYKLTHFRPSSSHFTTES